MIYNTYISTTVNGEHLRFKVQYSADSSKEAIELALNEWGFPEYYAFSAVELSDKWSNALDQAGINY